LGHQGLKNIRNAPSWFRGVHNYWPVLLTHAQADLISLFTNLVERDPSVSANWRAFLELVQRSDYQPEFLSAAVEWGKEAIRMLVEQYQMSVPDSNAVHVQVLMSGFWDEPKYHQRGRFNPRKVDELAALALSCRGESGRIGRKVLPLVREFYSLKWYVPIESADDLRKRIDKVLSAPRTINWCVCYPFTASLQAMAFPRVTGEADHRRMHGVLKELPPRSINDLPGARFPIIQPAQAPVFRFSPFAALRCRAH